MRIRTKTFIFMLLLVIPSLIIPAYFGVTITSEELKKKTIQNLQDSGDRIMDSVSKLIYERISDLQLLTEKNSLLNNELITIPDKIKYLKSLERSSKMYSSISIYDESGIRIGNTRNIAIGDDFSEHDFFINAIKGDVFYSKTPVYVHNLNQHVLHFSGPIYQNNSNFVVDMVFPTFKIQEIFDDVSQPIQLNLISADNKIIFSNHNSSYTGDTSKCDTTIQDYFEIQNNIFESNDHLYVLSQETGFLTYTGNNWQLLQCVPLSFTFQTINDLQNLFIVISSIIAIVAIIFVIVFSISLSRPILNLHSAIRKIKKGNLNIHVKPTGGDELIELGNSFNQMINRVKHSQNELITLDRTKTEFISMITHELKNPIVPIMGYCDLLMDETFGALKDKQKKIIGIILKNALILEKLISDFLDLERLELGKLSLNITRVSTITLFDTIESQHKNLAKNRNITFIVNQKENLYANADFDRLIQIFNNFILNAYEFLKSTDKRVEIGAYNDKKNIVFYIKDNGIGISDEKVTHLFKKFYQIDTSITRKHGGSGLGLSICKGLIEAQNGRVWCESKINKGTIFYFTMPQSEKDEDITN